MELEIRRSYIEIAEKCQDEIETAMGELENALGYLSYGKEVDAIIQSVFKSLNAAKDLASEAENAFNEISSHLDDIIDRIG